MAGFHVPVIKLFDSVGKIGLVKPEQIGAIAVNVGVTFVATATLIVVPIAHCPVVGVKVYVPETVLLIIVGLHVPVIELLDVKSKIGLVEPEQIWVISVKLGVKIGLTVTVTEAVVAHCPASGVKV